MKICLYPAGWREHLHQHVGACRPWLLDRGSLTRRILTRCQDFSVRGVRMEAGWAAPEGAASRPQRALLREVFLCCGDTPLVYAHSLLPLASLSGRWRSLCRLGGRPLGDILFSDPLVKRAPLQYKKLTQRHWLYRRACRTLENPPDCLWARRSTFTLNCRSIQVTEVFLPAILALPQ